MSSRSPRTYFFFYKGGERATECSPPFSDHLEGTFEKTGSIVRCVRLIEDTGAQMHFEYDGETKILRKEGAFVGRFEMFHDPAMSGTHMVGIVLFMKRRY